MQHQRFADDFQLHTGTQYVVVVIGYSDEN